MIEANITDHVRQNTLESIIDYMPSLDIVVSATKNKELYKTIHVWNVNYWSSKAPKSPWSDYKTNQIMFHVSKKIIKRKEWTGCKNTGWDEDIRSEGGEGWIPIFIKVESWEV